MDKKSKDNNGLNPSDYKVAYFSMEIALESAIKTYSGGLGILAGDILRSASDLKLPLVGVTLLSAQGYFKQKINDKGEQEEFPADDYDFSRLTKLAATVEITIGREQVKVGAWQYLIVNKNGFIVPVYLLDTDLPANEAKYRDITKRLYGGGEEERLLQEIVLGRGGFEILKKLGFNPKKYHINEGHGSLVAVSFFLDSKKRSTKSRLAHTKEACVFTTHTPIKMAHDVFPLEKFLTYQPDFPHSLPGLADDGAVNMTRTGLYFSGYINGVAWSHQEVSSQMFPKYPIHAVTNGVHSTTWTSPEMAAVFDRHIPAWRRSSFSLRNAFIIPSEEIWQAHQEVKARLIRYIKEKTGQDFSLEAFTIGYARRFTAYKRPELLLSDMERLLRIQKRQGPIQIVYAGKAHPLDEIGKEMIADITRISRQYQGKIKLVFLEGYEIDLAKLLVAGVDLWLNTPLPPNEASGTSGMKAAHNGVPQLSSVDGWWREGYIHGKTGWAIRGEKIAGEGSRDAKDAESIYRLLGEEIMPTYYHDQKYWHRIMRFAIGVNASYFNTERVLREYSSEATYVKPESIDYEKNSA